MSIIKGGKNPKEARMWYDWALTPEAQALGAEAKAFQIPSNQQRQGAAAGAAPRADQGHRLRLREVRLVGGAQAAAVEVGQGSQSTTQVIWIAATAAGLVLLPWYAIEGSWWGAPALLHGFQGQPWLLALFLPSIGALAARPWRRARMQAGVVLIARWAARRARADARSGIPVPPSQHHARRLADAARHGLWRAARGASASSCCSARGSRRAASAAATHSWSARSGWWSRRSRRFVFFPIFVMLGSAFEGNFVASFFDRSIWGIDCLYSSLRCGVAWNTVFLAILVGAGSTLLGLAFALIAARTAFRYKAALRVMSVLPIITPPFVIGLAIILLFGRAGAVSALLFDWFDIPRSRWIYGLAGVAFAQLLAFTPIAFLVLLGVVQGISPSLEEASQTLRARGWTTFRTVTLPLLRPGLAAAFLLGFVESMADFGNPLVLAG